ncbi:P-loop containing nucleoside triphosphate hydrolase protein [Poronia punctata]|nr:P-loop containing nucleoside triphosphate hydrolase protein [Poronia punctata]
MATPHTVQKAVSATTTTTTTRFIPRTTFQLPAGEKKTYYLGHHAKALRLMNASLSRIGLIIECRDSRVPLSSTNPLFETHLKDRKRIIVFTKSSLCANKNHSHILRQERILREYYSNALSSSSPQIRKTSEQEEDEFEEQKLSGDALRDNIVLFTDDRDRRSIVRLLDEIRKCAVGYDTLLGLRALVVGMPNVGKSSLLNALRREGMKRDLSKVSKAAKTGGQPGVTRNAGTPVRILPRPNPDAMPSPETDYGEGVFVVDTPGVFIPYIQDPLTMLKLAMVGCVGEKVVDKELMVDYLLFHLNLRDPAIYKHLSPPTNDIGEFLDNVGRRTGKLMKGGQPSHEEASAWVLQQWRVGRLGRFCLDDISREALAARSSNVEMSEPGLSMSQAKKREKVERKERIEKKVAAKKGGGLGL